MAEANPKGHRWSDRSSEKKREGFARTFKAFAKKGDEKDDRVVIQTEKLRNVLELLHQTPNEEEYKTMVEELDPNGKGEITLEKFLSMMEKTINDDMERMFKGMFRMTDTDNDGFLSRAEVATAIREMDEDFTDEQLNELMIEGDTNLDGKLNFEEFMVLVKKYYK